MALLRSIFSPVLIVSTLLLGGCASQEELALRDPIPEDPYEASNRQFHAVNEALDTAVLRPASQAYGAVVPKRLRNGLSNASNNLGLPLVVVNNLLQGKVEDALHNTTRFLVNSTFGLAGLNDVAREMGINERSTDFGETLGTWGVAEGAYLEMPLIGPTTERDFIALPFDMAMDPLGFILNTKERRQLMALRAAKRLNDRVTFGTTVDQILYESADSYAQTRLLFLESRHYALGEAVEDDYFDPYSDEQ